MKRIKVLFARNAYDNTCWLYLKFFITICISCCLLFFFPCISNAQQSRTDPKGLLLKFQKGFLLPETRFDLIDPAPNSIINYSKYGEFKNIGTDKYNYVIKDKEA